MQVRIFDGCFPFQKSATLAGDNLGESPMRVEWCREDCDSLYTWYTDTNLWRAEEDFHPERIAWLIEPPSISDTHYKQAHNLRSKFRAIFTFNKDLVGKPPYRYYPLGGSWIRPENWGMHPKSKNISIIASEKNKSLGHRMRHELIKIYDGQVDVFGSGYNPIDSKLEALAPYRFAIIVESCKLDGYFSEKLVDCLSVGTVPIYWGDPSIDHIFYHGSIFEFDNIGDLLKMPAFTEELYESLRPQITANIQKAMQYRIAEDWIWARYPEYFR